MAEEVVAVDRELELRLLDGSAPNGEIPVKDLAVALALQELMTRIGREVVSTPGPGRTKQFMEEFAQLRLRSVDQGSTVLRFSRGAVDQLDVDISEQRLADDQFWKVIEAISQDRRPEGVTDLIADSAARLVNALRHAAPRSVLSSTTRGAIEMVSARMHPETWTARRVHGDTAIEVRGRLEKVDLRSGAFRIRDDVDHTTDLKRVRDDVTAARLVGSWVAANGRGVFVSDQLVALDDASVFAVDDPARDFEGDEILNADALLAAARVLTQMQESS